jgi:carboxyl-terminal processing protease
MLTQTTGYVAITHFYDSAYVETTSALEKLSNQGMKELVLDLRGNSGGIVAETFDIISLFFDEQSPVVATRSNNPYHYSNTFYTKYGGAYATLPIVLLVDYGSASASEIVAGVFQDKDRAMIVGGTTWGKAMVLSTFALPSGNGWLTLSTNRLYMPSGRCVQVPYSGRKRMLSPFTIDTLLINVDHHFERTVLGQNTKYFLSAKNRPMYDSIGIIPDYFIPRYANNATKKVLYSGSFFDSTYALLREMSQRTYIELPTATKFYSGFRSTSVGKAIRRKLESVPLDSGINRNEVDFDEIMRYVSLFYSFKVNSYWAYTREALLDDRQVQFALTLLQPKQEPVAKPVIKKVKKGKSVKRGAKS